MKWGLLLAAAAAGLVLAGCLFKGGYSLRQVVRPAKLPWLEPPGLPEFPSPYPLPKGEGAKRELVVLPARTNVLPFRWPAGLTGMYYFHLEVTTNCRTWRVVESNRIGWFGVTGLVNDPFVGATNRLGFYREHATRTPL